MSRNAYLLTCDSNSERCLFSKKILEDIGFNVILYNAIPNSNPLTSHKLSMIEIYKIIANDESSEWSYVFEDDINILENITLDEIIQYENISSHFFYLGLCKYGGFNTITKTNHIINGHQVYKISKYVRGLHAVAFSRTGMASFLNFMDNFTNEGCVDMILESYSIKCPANVVRIDLQSYIPGHMGIIFQDRNKFKSIISNH
jgi:hypothetical protein